MDLTPQGSGNSQNMLVEESSLRRWRALLESDRVQQNLQESLSWAEWPGTEAGYRRKLDF